MKPPLSRCGMPQANSTTSWPRLTSPSASETTLPCSLVMISASSPLRAVEQLAEVEQDLGALGQRGVAPRRERRGGGVDHGAGVLDAAEGQLAGDLPGRGVGDRRRGPLVPGKTLLLIQWPMVLVMSILNSCTWRRSRSWWRAGSAKPLARSRLRRTPTTPSRCRRGRRSRSRRGRRRTRPSRRRRRRS